MRAHVLCPSVTCAVHSANRTHHAGHVGFYTRAHAQNPSSPNPTTQPGLCPSAGSANPPRAFPDRVLTLAAVHAGVSSVARHGPSVRCRVDPGRSRLQLPPLPGICPAIVAVIVATHATRSCASRRPDFTLPFHSPRETRPHVRTWRPSSPGEGLNVVVCSLNLVTRGSMSARRERRLRLRLWRAKCRVAAVVAIGTVPGLHSSARMVRAVPRTRPPRARLRR